MKQNLFLINVLDNGLKTINIQVKLINLGLLLKR